MSKQKIINIVSGKGGTGKTLLTSVLAEIIGNEDSNVLIIDLDVFVRGLTSLLYYHKKGKLLLSDINEITISEFFIDKGDFERSGKNKLAISRYRSFDVMPSVSRVDEILAFDDIMPDSKQEAIQMLNNLIAKIPKKYEYIFLDSRAGYDELVSASHYISDVTICVEEEDNISRITSNNLINQLKEDSDNHVFRLINKTKNNEINIERMQGVDDIGYVPFDMDVMNSFGTKYFWEDISKTLYKKAIATCWNTLSNKLDWKDTINDSRATPIGNEKIEKKLQFYSIKDRIILVYGLIVGFLGTAMSLSNTFEISRMLMREEVIFGITGILGFSMSAWIIFKKR